MSAVNAADLPPQSQQQQQQSQAHPQLQSQTSQRRSETTPASATAGVVASGNALSSLSSAPPRRYIKCYYDVTPDRATTSTSERTTSTSVAHPTPSGTSSTATTAATTAAAATTTSECVRIALDNIHSVSQLRLRLMRDFSLPLLNEVRTHVIILFNLSKKKQTNNSTLFRFKNNIRVYIYIYIIHKMYTRSMATTDRSTRSNRSRRRRRRRHPPRRCRFVDVEVEVGGGG
jgi:hypothetical protein